jgi:poly(3-hydroxybutyrate) depolymerase
MPAILLQGEADRVVRTINQSQLASQFRTLNHLGPDSAVPVVRKAANRNRAGCRIEDYRLGRKLLLRVCNIDGLGHAWSGGDDTLKYTEGKGPDASAMMWDFFARHKRRDSKPASTVI